jgi:spore maturation protein CgeB
MNEELLALIRARRPLMTIFVPSNDEFIPDIIGLINNYTTTVAYLFDDVWRVEYSKFWAKHFDYVTTSDVNGVKRWRDLGLTNFIYSPFATNPKMYLRQSTDKIFDITFVGQYHPYRGWLMKRLRRAGLNVLALGPGWPGGYLNLSEVVAMFNQSKINLNLSNNESWDLRYVGAIGRSPIETARVWRATIRGFGSRDVKTTEMVKARHFEIASTAGFQLSYYVEGLEQHFVLGQEIAVYSSADELAKKCRYYLAHPTEREEIARRGYVRTLREHSLEYRFRDLLNAITERK